MALYPEFANDLMVAVASKAMALGCFQKVTRHEPKSAPGRDLTAGMWVDTLDPVGTQSGLSATSGRVVLKMNVYNSFKSMPEDDIDPKVLTATCRMVAALTGDFQLDGFQDLMCVDLLGMSGISVSARTGYIKIDSLVFRCMTITIPLLFNNLFDQVA